MSLSPRWTFLALFLFFVPAWSYGLENGTIAEDMFRAYLVERADAPHGSQTMQYEGFYRHIVAVGDVHGNLDNLKKVLCMAGVTDEASDWGGSKPPQFLVQVGDLMDKGNQVREVFAFFDKLRKETPGKIFTLFGNHEWRNIIGDWWGVSNVEMEQYNNDVQARYKMISKGEIGISLKEHFRAALRLPLHPSAGKPNQAYNPEEAKSPLSHAALAFIHAGFTLDEVQRPLLARFPETINQASASLLEKMQRLDPPPKVYLRGSGKKRRGAPKALQITDNEKALLDRDNGPFWYRGWAEDSETMVCRDVDKVLELTGTRRVIVGHTSYEVILSKCDGKLIFIDTDIRKGGLSALSIEYRLMREGKGPWLEEEIIRAITLGRKKKIVEYKKTHIAI